ncbi:MAG: FkbM family methyltransferase [Terrimicrobiaceae bacterium]
MEVLPKDRHEKKGTTPSALQRARGRGICPGTVIDVGASDGRWSVATSRVFPEARFHMLEPLLERKESLEALCAKTPAFRYRLAAASDRCGSAHLAVSEDLDGSALSADGQTGARLIDVTTIDFEVAKNDLLAPYLIKLDTHGFEAEILRGALETLPQTEMLIIEAYNFNLGGEALRFPQLCLHLESLGFRCADLVDLSWRPSDGMLWQMDLVFIPSASPSFSCNAYA